MRSSLKEVSVTWKAYTIAGFLQGFMDRCVDFRYSEGHPGWEKALLDGTRAVRVISLPEMEMQAKVYLEAGIRVFAVYTGESDQANRYVMRNCSALIIGNEPKWVYPHHIAAWPDGTANDYVNVFSHVANVLVPEQHPGLPLLGAGFWAHHYAEWAKVAGRLPNLSGATVHVYPIATGHSLATVKKHLQLYRDVRPDLPLVCGEYTVRGNALAWSKTLDTYCTKKFWYGPGDPTHALEGSDEYGILALA